MKTTPTMKDVAEMLGKVSADDVERRLSDIHSEARALKALLRTLRAREAAARRKQRRTETDDAQ